MPQQQPGDPTAPLDPLDIALGLGRPPVGSTPVLAPGPTPDLRQKPPPASYDGLDRALGLVDPLDQSLRRGSEVPADRATRVLQLKAKTGLPTDLVDTNLETLERLQKQHALDPEHLRKAAPALADWLAGDRMAAAAISPAEVSKLSGLESFLRWTAAPLMRGLDQVEGGAFAVLEAASETLLGEDSYLTQFGREGRQRNRLEAEAWNVDHGSPTTGFSSIGDFGTYLYQTVGEQIPNMAAGAAAGAVAGSVLPGLGTVAGMSIGALIGAFVPAYIQGAGEIQSAIKEIDPNAKAPLAVFVGGAAVGALDTVLPGKVGSKLVRTFGKETAEQIARKLLVTTVKPKFLVRTAKGAISGLATEAITEAAQEVIGGLAEAHGTSRPVDWHELGLRSIEAGIAGGLTGGVFEGGVEAYTHRHAVRAAIQAEQQEQVFKALNTGVADSEAMKALPQQARAWVASVVKDGPIEQVYVPIEQWDDYWQQAGASPDVVAAEVTGRPDALDVAKASGTGLLTIDTADYATKIAGTDHGAFFQAEVKLDPKKANAREAREARQRAEQALGDAKLREQLATAGTEADKQQQLLLQLTELYREGGMSRYEAQKVAALQASRYLNRARLYGEDPYTLFARDPRVVFVALRNGAPLDPLFSPQQAAARAIERLSGTPAAPGQAAPTGDAGAPVAAMQLPPDTLTQAREDGLTAAFQALPTTPEGEVEPPVPLTTAGFSPEEIAAFDALGLSTQGAMTREQFIDYLQRRHETLQAVQRAQVGGLLPDLPASVAPAGETSQDRARRRRMHLAALVSALHRPAVQLDPTVTPDQIRAELERRQGFDEERLHALRDSDRGQGLLRAIAANGGLWYDEKTRGARGEVLFYAREARDKKDAGERGGRSAEAYDAKEWDDLQRGTTTRGVVPTWNGIPGVFRRDGLTLDAMVEALTQEGDFPNLRDGNQLLDMIDDALRAERDVDSFPGTADLGRLAIDPTTRWWEQAWGVAPEVTAAEREFDQDDDSFDVSQFEQRVVGDTYVVRESALQRQRRGDRQVVSIDAGAFRQLWETQHPGEQLPWHPGRTANLRTVEAVDAYPSVAVSPLGLVEVGDGRHRIALAAERGLRIPVAVEPGVTLPATVDPRPYTVPPTVEDDFEQRARAGKLPHGAVGSAINEDEHEVRLPGDAYIHLTEPGVHYDSPQGYLFVADVFVPKERRRQGKGRQLYEAAVAYALSQGYRGLASFPMARNEQSEGMWRALAREGSVEHRGDGFDTVTYTGGDFFQRRAEPRGLPQDFSQRKAPGPIPPSLDRAAGFEGIAQAVQRHFAKGGADLTTADLQDLIQAQVDQAIAKTGRTGPLDPTDPRVQDYLVRVLTAEGLAALQQHPEAVGWYNLRVQQARELVGLVHPEVLTDDNAWFVFTYLLAVLSNGTTVRENFKSAVRAYEFFNETGKVPTNLGRGVPATTVNNALRMFNEQVEQRGGVEGGGVQAFRTMLMQQHRVGDLKKQPGFKSVAGLVDETVYAAAVLGPKIGNGFLLNLNGIYSQLTFDRWWSRAWGRLTGSLDMSNPKLADQKRRDIRAAVADLKTEERALLESLVGPLKLRTNADVEAFAKQVAKIAAETGGRGEALKGANVGPGLDLVRRLSNRLGENIRSYRLDPQGDTERAMMDLVARRALANIQAAGYPDLTPADFQAVLWYPEKRLYETAKKGEGVSGYGEEGAPDYANAATKFVTDEGATPDAISGALARGAGRAAEAQRAVQPGVGQPSAQPLGRRRDARRQVVDDGEFFQTAGPVTGSTLAMFYSRLAQPVRDAKVEKAKGRDWAAIIKNAKTGINLDEYAAVGVQALEQQGANETFTRAEVLDFLHANRVQIETIELADPSALVDPRILERETERLIEERVREYADDLIERGRGPESVSPSAMPMTQDGVEGWVATHDGEPVDGQWSDLYETEDDALKAAEERAEEADRQAEKNWLDDIRTDVVNWDEAERDAREKLEEDLKDREAHYSTHVAAGAVEGTYRELFITAPSAATARAQAAQRALIEQALARAVAKQETGESEEIRAEGSLTRKSLQALLDSGDFSVTRGGYRAQEDGEGFNALTPGRNAFVQHFEPTLAREVADAGRQQLGVNWRDGHPGYEQVQNPIVRLRYNVRRVPVTGQNIVEARQRPDGRWHSIVNGERVSSSFGWETEAQALAFAQSTIRGRVAPTRAETVLFLEEVQPPLKEPRVGINEFDKMPDLFQKNWRELAMRYVLQLAATQGYDRVAWTSGDMQVDRYGLRREARSLSYRHDTQTLEALGEDAQVLLHKSGVKPEDVHRFVGQANADALLAAHPQPYSYGTGTWVQVEAEPGTVFGGEGLARLYDKDFPAVANKLPVMRKTGTTATTMPLPNMGTAYGYNGPTLTRAQVQAISDAPSNTTVMNAADFVLARMDEGMPFEMAMRALATTDYGPALSLTLVVGGSIEIVPVPKTVPGIVVTPHLKDALRARGQEFFQAGRRRRADAPYDQTLHGAPITVDPFTPTLATRTEMVTQSTRTLPVSSVQNAHDAAAAMGYLAAGAQERFDGLVVDENGTPLALIGGFKGTVDMTALHPDVLLAEALGVPGAARVWFAHNHPSGVATLSQDDRETTKVLRRVFKASGIEVMGNMAIGAGFGPDRQWEWTPDGLGATEGGTVRAPQPGVATPVPMQEREFVAHDTLDNRPITTPALASAVVPAVAQGRFGVVFLDVKNVARGFAPLDEATAYRLKDAGRARALYETWAASGARRAFVYTPSTDFTGLGRAYNVANALHAVGVEVLDIVDPDGARGLTRNVLSGAFTQPGDMPGDVKGAFNRQHGWIRLIAGAADLSTFLHESGHAFLHEMMTDALEFSLRDPATLTDLQRRHLQDAQTVLTWFNFTGTTGDFLALSTDDQRQMHEQWARSFEVYLMTGQAPSAELRPIFATFRAWLSNAYRLLFRRGALTQEQAEAALSREAGFTVTLPKEIREVMERLLASDEAIAAVKAEADVVPLFTDAASAGVDALTFAAYQRQVEEASLKAREALDARLLQDWRKAQQAEWQRERDQVLEQITSELNADPLVVAQSVIRTGRMPDGSIPPFADGRPLKLSKADIIRMKGKDFLKRLPKPYLYTVTGGLSPNDVAELTGFSSGEELLDALVNARNPRQVAQAEADKRMVERHGDEVLDGLELKDLAEQNIHAHRADVISAELQALTRGLASAAIPSTAALRAEAEARVGSMQVRELVPGVYLQAATRASQRAFEAFARNDRAAAVQHKIDELSSLALYRAAAEAKDRAQKTATLLNAYQTSPGRRRTLLSAGQDYLDQIDALLERYEFSKTTQRAQERRLTLRKFIEAQQANGMPVDIPDWVIDDARLINYTRLTTTELEDIRETVDHIAHLARLKKRLLDARTKKELAEVQQEIAGTITATWQQRPEVYEPRHGVERVKAFSAGVFYSHRKLASLARQLDGFVDGGPMWSYVIRRLNEAANQEAAKQAAALTTVKRLFETHFTPRERLAMKAKRVVPELQRQRKPPTSLTREALLMLALNQGNDQNRQRLRDGYGWTQDQVQHALDAHLDKRNWDFVQAVWDAIDTYWPEIMEKQRRVMGSVPAKVLATPVLTRFGEYRGGYFPIKFDGEISGRNLSLDLANAADLAKAAAYVQSTTTRGHLQRRAEGDVTERPLRLDFGVITEHLAQVIHDLTHHEMLIDVGRILDADAAVAKAITSTHGVKAYEQFRTGLRDIAIGDIPARHETEKIFGYMRNGQTVVGLGLNMMTVGLQYVGYMQTVHRIGPRWAGQGLASMLRGALTMENTAKGIRDESLLMATRWGNISPELHDLREKLGIHSGLFAPYLDTALRTVTADKVTKQGIADGFMYFIGKAQMLVDIPTYLGAKAKAAADPANRRADGTLDEERVVALAEQAVIDSQGGGSVKDLAAVQRGGPMFKLWINFYSFFNVVYNAWAESWQRSGMRGRRLTNPVAMGRLAADVLILFTAPTVLTHFTRALFRGGLSAVGDELEDEELFWTLLNEQLSYMAGMMVLVREFGGFIEGRARYEGPAGTRGITTVGKVVGRATRGKLDDTFWKNLNDAGGVLLHYPAGQVERTWKGITALMNGETDYWGAPIFGPPPD